MKEDLLGLNHWLSFAATCHTVRPRSSAKSSGHLRIAPPKSSSDMPKCFRYHAARAALSPLLLKKTPPIPVIFATVALLLSRSPNARVHLQGNQIECVAKPRAILSSCQVQRSLGCQLRAQVSHEFFALGPSRAASFLFTSTASGCPAFFATSSPRRNCAIAEEVSPTARRPSPRP